MSATNSHDQDFLVYVPLIERLSVLDKKDVGTLDVDEGIRYRSPLQVELRLEAGKVQYRLIADITNPLTRPWLYPNHRLKWSNSFRVNDANGLLVDSGPHYVGHRIRLVDSMFAEIPQNTTFSIYQDFDISKLEATGKGKFCAKFENNSLPESIGEYFVEEKRLSVLTVMGSQEICFDLVQTERGSELKNIRSVD